MANCQNCNFITCPHAGKNETACSHYEETSYFELGWYNEEPYREHTAFFKSQLSAEQFISKNRIQSHQITFYGS